MLSVRGLAKSFAGPPPRPVLAGVSLELAAGEYLAVMGESGSGKSTLLNCIAGLERPDAGSILFDGIDIARLPDDKATRLRRQRIGFVFQAFHLLPYLSVEGNVSLPLRLNGLGGREAVERTAAMLSSVGLAERAHSFPRELSGGEMQRVAIARALAHGPALLLADEPTGNLDADAARQVLSLLRDEVRARGAAAILVTHSAAAARTADRVVRLTAKGLEPAEAAGPG